MGLISRESIFRNRSSRDRSVRCVVTSSWHGKSIPLSAAPLLLVQGKTVGCLCAGPHTAYAAASA